MSKPIDKIIISGMMRGEGGTSGKKVPTPLPTPEPISPINNQQFSATPRKLTITWKPVNGATSYEITLQWYSNTPQGKTWLAKPAYASPSTQLTIDFPACCPGR